MGSPADFWFDQLGNYPVLEPLEALQLFKEVRKGLQDDGTLTPKAERALKKVVSHNMRFVVKVWHTKYSHLVRSNSPLLPDLLQEGAYGLHKAALNYKPESGYKFSTYSSYWIRRYINLWLCNRERVVRAPSMAVHVNNYYAVHKVGNTHNKCIEMTAEHYGITTNLVMDYLRCVNTTRTEVYQISGRPRLEIAGSRVSEADSLSQAGGKELDPRLRKQFDLIACRAQLDPYEREVLLAFQQGFGLLDLPKLFPDDKHVVKRYQAIRRRFKVAAKELFSGMSSLSVA